MGAAVGLLGAAASVGQRLRGRARAARGKIGEGGAARSASSSGNAFAVSSSHIRDIGESGLGLLVNGTASVFGASPRARERETRAVPLVVRFFRGPIFRGLGNVTSTKQPPAWRAESVGTRSHSPMTTRISQDGPLSEVNVAPTAHRVTPKPATPFKSVLQASTLAVLNGAESAARRLPGGEILAAAVRPGAAAAAPFVASGGAPAGAVGGPSTSPTDPTGAGGGAGNGGIEDALARQSQDTMFYLNLQMQVQDENRYYTTMSNTMKARHDTVKNSIGNLR